MWEEGFGDDGAGSDDGFVWRERLWGYNDNPAKTKNKRRKDDDGSDASGTPVELVYVPPFNSRYSYEYPGYGEGEEDDEDDDSLGGIRGFGDDEELEEEDYASGIVHSRPSYRREDSDGAASDIYLHRGTAAGSVGFEDYPDTSDKHLIGSPVPGIPIPIPANSVGSDIGRMEYIGPSNAEATIPKLVVMEQGKVKANVEEEDADFFDGDPDYGNEYMPRIHRPARPGYGSSSRFMIGSDERPSRSTSRTGSSRSRSKSHSRTPSPAMDSISPASNSEPSAPSYSSASPSPNYSSHLLPPTRGRSHQDLLQSSSRTQSSAQSQSRGRSSARTSGSSSLESSTSPFGGMSPDSANSRYGSATAYGGGGRLDRDRTGGERRGREPFRERERGRDRTTDKRLSVSVSNSPEPPTRAPRIERETSSATTTTSTVASAEMDSSFVSSASSTSSSKTVIPAEPASPPMSEEDYQREAEEFLRRTGPTPSNSPVIEMRAPPSIPPPGPSEQGTPTPSSIAAAAASSSSNVPTPTSKLAPASTVPSTSAKAKPPPLAPSPPHPAKPSTSYTAVSSPTNKGNSSPSRLMTSPTTPPSNNALGIRETSPAGRAGRSKSPQSDSIMGKAAEIAGAFFGLWNHSSASATSPS
ncbi:hypothetical protein MD484_g1795, partial [Candolleomyces efflorescens]